ncbi:uncharacterized protein dyl [Macrobrachium rosenbergii]|uniref:uncharacterized protein dyl n=1 Tax=Macrobrachium rosenbergii TaxID=79674 RepID=UPI0034D66426
MRVSQALLFLGCLALIHGQAYDQNALDSASLPVEHRGADGFGPQLGGGVGLPGVGLPGVGLPGLGGGPDESWPLSQPDMPSIKNLQVQCEKSFMRVNVEFDRPFYGMIFSKGYYSDQNCVHVQPGSGRLQAQFDIYLNSCGMTSSSSGNYGQPTPSGTFIENTVIIQYDPLVQEVWDAARKLRCTWYDYYEKSVTFRPFQVDMLNAVTANFLGDNLQCWMQIQVGKGPWASEVSGIVKIGQTMTMVLAIKDDENKFDMMVRNCVAHDGKRAPIQLVDERGCITRPKIMGRFLKVKNFGSSASVVSYAYFQAFKFPDSMNVHFQCVIQVCRYSCPEPQCDGLPLPPTGYQAAASDQVASVAALPGSGLPDPRTPNSANAIPDESAPVYAAQRQAEETDNILPEEHDKNIPFPVPVPLKAQSVDLPRPGYPNVNRQGNLMDNAGRPRKIDFDALDDEEEETTETRRKRSAVLHVYRRAAQEMTDVSTARVIQVVAPGDVAFNLNSANETVVVSEMLDDPSNICMSATGFAAGLVMLLLVLTIACLVACFLYTRVRTFNAKGSVTTFVQGFDNPEFVKVAATN